LRTLPLATQYRELLSQRELLCDEARPWAEGGPERTEDRDQEAEHDLTFAEVVAVVIRESPPSLR
jgi:hypothetical protein